MAFTIERTYNASASKIWKAISDRDEMAKWYFDLKEFKAEVGFEFKFEGGPSPDNQFTHLCKVTEVIPNKKLTYSWRYDGYEGIFFVAFASIKSIILLKMSSRENFKLK